MLHYRYITYSISLDCKSQSLFQNLTEDLRSYLSVPRFQEKFNYSGVRMRLYTRSVRRSSHVQGYVASGRELCKVIDTYDTSWLVVIRLSS